MGDAEGIQDAVANGHGRGDLVIRDVEDGELDGETMRIVLDKSIDATGIGCKDTQIMFGEAM